MPTYPLTVIRGLAAIPDGRRLTVMAEETALIELGMTRSQVFAVVAGLLPDDFYKTMASRRKPGLSQDVYRPLIRCAVYPLGIRVYCKVQLTSGALVINVISFKKL